MIEERREEISEEAEVEGHGLRDSVVVSASARPVPRPVTEEEEAEVEGHGLRDAVLIGASTSPMPRPVKEEEEAEVEGHGLSATLGASARPTIKP